MKPELIFLKLGGSLITNKDRPHSARRRLIRRLALEIKQALVEHPEISIILGHGSGSFAHIPAAKHGTRQGVESLEQWMGFVEVWKEARALNQIVIEECLNASLPVIAFPPSATHIATGRQGLNTSLPMIQAALNASLIPVVYGDVIFDQQIGGTIFSTEEVFSILVEDIKPARILLAGYEKGVFQDFPHRRNVIGTITPKSYKMKPGAAGASASIDVTGGMYKKVDLMVQLVSIHPDLAVQIFSGRQPGILRMAISGERPGTRICSII
jgi:isopentenyl phosphate kinase